MEPSDVSLAVAAATSTAEDMNMPVDAVSVLHNSNRLALKLDPSEVLARVAPPGLHHHDVAAFEVEMAQRLDSAGSLVGRLEPRVEPAVYVRDGFAVTFWRYYEPLPVDGIPPAAFARALEAVHAEMLRSDAVAPHFTDRVDEAQAIVDDASQSPDLVAHDRELLSSTLLSLRHTILARGTREQLLHGEPHPGNVLNTAQGIRFIDLQTCCYGPVEFDIAHAPDEVGSHYADADPRQLRDCRSLMRAMVAAWRADRTDEFPNGREMLRVLLEEIRSDLRGRSS